MKPGDLALMIRLPAACGEYIGLPATQPGEICTILGEGGEWTWADEPTWRVRSIRGYEHWAWKRTLVPLPPPEELGVHAEDEASV